MQLRANQATVATKTIITCLTLQYPHYPLLFLSQWLSYFALIPPESNKNTSWLLIVSATPHCYVNTQITGGG